MHFHHRQVCGHDIKRQKFGLTMRNEVPEEAIAQKSANSGVRDTGTGRLGRRALIAGVGGLAGIASVGSPAAAATFGADSYVVDVVAKGADPTGKTPSDEAFRQAAAELLGSFQTNPISDVTPVKTLLIPPGNYVLTEPDSLLPGGDGTSFGHMINGIAICGYGKRISRITYAPKIQHSTMWTNHGRYKNIRISGLTFDSKEPTSTFNYCYSSATYGVQDTWYTDVEWRGSWKIGIGLDGPIDKSNLNSEMGWDHCQISGSYSRAFLVIGMTPSEPQQDQFLNYWFRDCKVEFTSGTFVENERGGSMNFIGGSYIVTDSLSTGVFFKLGTAGTGRADSVMRLYAQGIRFELRGAKHKVIESGWYKGTVTFVSCDDTALSFQAFAAGTPAHTYHFDVTDPPRGPMVRYQDCALMGYHEVTTGDTATIAGKLRYEGCRFINQAASIGGSGFLRWTGNPPWYEFRDCLVKSSRLTDAQVP
jgi:hypothetical protein